MRILQLNRSSTRTASGGKVGSSAVGRRGRAHPRGWRSPIPLRPEKGALRPTFRRSRAI